MGSRDERGSHWRGRGRGGSSEPEPDRPGTDSSAHDPFDLAGSDPELLSSGRIPDPQPEHTPFFHWIAGVLTAIEERLRARGGPALRNGIRALWVIVGLIGVFLLVGPIINKPLDFDDVIASAKMSKVDWVARDAKVDYALSRDADGRFVAAVSERFTADFAGKQEPRIARTIVTEYGGHDVRFQLGEVTVDGAKVTPKETRHPTTTLVEILPPRGEKFSGTHTITYSYVLRDLVTSETDQASGKTVDRWDWPLFAPTWPQATKGIEVSLSLTPDLERALVRPPQAYVGWLLLSTTSWLQPDGESASGATEYSFSNDQTLPPNADLWVSANFKPGTFTQPPTTALFWMQTYGPILPLLLLAAIALGALAARRIVWADSAGKPWFLPRSEPPAAITAAFAAQLLDRPRHASLVAALADPPRASRAQEARTHWLSRLARAAQRTGRPGALPETMHWAGRWSRGGTVVERGLRWVPRGYVRDAFLLAPIALALLQWGLLRQLSAQVVLAIVWWPAVFVLLSTALAAIAFFAALSPRPLTKRGALAVQDLRGIDAFAKTTLLLERGPVDDPLLPYAALFERPRRAGREVLAQAQAESGDRAVASGWKGERFVTLPALLASLLALGVLAGSIVAAATIPAPYDESREFVTEYHDLPGSLYAQSTGFDISAQLGRDAKGRARIDVTEHHTVLFEKDAPRPPQFTREWPSTRLGQSLGIAVDGIRIDGEKVPIREVKGRSTLAVSTALADVVEGEHEVDVSYSLTSAAVAARPDAVDASGIGAGASATRDEARSGWVDQVRWVALLEFWESDYRIDAHRASGESERERVSPARIEFAIAPGLADEAIAAGWLRVDGDQPRERDELGNAIRPWHFGYDFFSDTTQRVEKGELGAFTRRDDGAAVATLDLDAQADPAFSKNDAGLGGDLGARLDFPAGTFTGVSESAAESYAFGRTVPFVATVVLAGVILIGAIALAWFMIRSARPAGSSGRALAFFALPVLAVAQSVLNGWTIMPMPGDSAIGGVAIATGIAMWLAVLVAGVIVWRRSPELGRESPSKQQKSGEE